MEQVIDVTGLPGVELALAGKIIIIIIIVVVVAVEVLKFSSFYY